MSFEYRPATPEDLDAIWAKNICDNHGSVRWHRWREEYIEYNKSGAGKSFVFVSNGEPQGEGTLLFSPGCSAVAGDTRLADGKTTANINALRNDPKFENQGHISTLVRLMEQYAKAMGYTTLTIGVEEKERRNRKIYEHWGYTRELFRRRTEGETVLYYAKDL